MSELYKVGDRVKVKILNLEAWNEEGATAMNGKAGTVCEVARYPGEARETYVVQFDEPAFFGLRPKGSTAGYSRWHFGPFELEAMVTP